MKMWSFIYLFASINAALCENYDPEFSVNFNDLCDTIWIAGMIDVPRQSAR